LDLEIVLKIIKINKNLVVLTRKFKMSMLEEEEG